MTSSCRPLARGPAALFAALLLSAPAVADLPGDLTEIKPLVRLPVDFEPSPPDRPAPRPAALSCPMPCSSGTLEALHPFYDVFLNCWNGQYTARTGAFHSVTALAGGIRQNVIYGGQSGSPGTSDISLHVHGTGMTYTNPAGGQACLFDPPDTPGEPNSIGIEQEWTLSPQAGVTLILRQEIVAFGTTEDGSGVRLTLAVTNAPTSTADANIGLRWQIDYQNAFDDGPLYAPVRCDPFEVLPEFTGEHELAPSEILDFYRIRNNGGTPIFSNYTGTVGLSQVPNTGTPDRLLFGYWPSLFGSPWSYVANEGDPAVDIDSAVLYYFGYLPADGSVLAPGESVRRSVVIFTSAETTDCGTFVPGCAVSIAWLPEDQVTCAGEAVTLDATGIDLLDCDGAVEHQWWDEGGARVGVGPIVGVAPSDTTDYTVTIQCTAAPECRTEHSVRVAVERAPVPGDLIVDDPDPCNHGLLLTWGPPTADPDALPVAFHLYRSPVSCDDALLRPPVARGLVDYGWVDVAPPAGELYHVLEVEDSRGSPACTPVGPFGGAVGRTCVGPVRDETGLDLPDGVGAVLRARHVGPVVTFTWPSVRPLLDGESFRMSQADEDPQGPWRKVNPHGDLSLEWSTTDPGELLFFELRVQNRCGLLSEPD